MKTIGTFTKKFKFPYCIIRKDLQEAKMSIPIEFKAETFMIHGTGGFRYRYIGEQFQIRFGRRWYNAYSIDFDFIN